MLSDDELKAGLHSDLKQSDKLVLLLASFDHPCSVEALKKKSIDGGFRIPNGWNVSARLKDAKGLAICTPKGWEITKLGLKRLNTLGYGKAGLAAVHIATSLRTKLTTIKSVDTRLFVDEAIKCYEASLYRSAIVMSWLSAIDVLYNVVHSQHLAVFNAEASRIDSKWRPARSVDDLSRMKESDFLDRLVAISMIGKNVKTELKNCLDRRNGCGHPNSLKIGSATVDHHLEILLLNVFEPFA